MQADAIPDELMAIVARLQTSNADNRAAAAKRDQAYSTLKATMEAAQEELRSERDAGVRREGRVDGCGHWGSYRGTDRVQDHGKPVGAPNGPAGDIPF